MFLRKEVDMGIGLTVRGRELIEKYANQIVEEVVSRFEPPWEGPEVRQFITERHVCPWCGTRLG